MTTRTSCVTSPAICTAVERVWHTYDIQGQILALTCRYKTLKSRRVFPLRSDVAFTEMLNAVQEKRCCNGTSPSFACCGSCVSTRRAV